MAKSVLELAVGTGQWDAGLKKAKSALDNFTQANGGLRQALDKESQKMQQFVRMMGGMESTAKTAKGQMNDYKSTIEQLTMQYNRMSKAQKKVVGQDYLQAIEQMKQKYQSVNKEIQDMNRSLKNVEMPEMKGGGMFSGMGDKMSGAMAVFGGNLMTKAAGAVAQLGSEMADMVKQGIEMAKAGEGVRIAFERLGNGQILDGLREATHGTVTDLELMKAAVKFNDFKLPLDELGTMLAFAQQKAKDTGQSVDYMVDSIVTGLGRKSLMILDNLGLSAAEIKDKMKDTGDMTKAVGAIIRDQMAKAGDYVETAADRAAQANVSLQNKMEELGRKFAPLQEASNSLWTSMKIGILDVIGGPLTDLLNKLTEAGRLRNALNNINGDGTKGNTQVSNKLKQLQAAKKSGASQYMLNTMQSGVIEGYNRQINEREQAIKDWNAWRRGSRSEGLQERIGQWRDKYGTDVNSIKAEADAYRTMIAEYRKGAKDIMTPVTVDVKTDNAVKSLDELKVKLSELQAQRKKVTAGSDEAKRLDTEIRQVKADIKLQDPNALKTTTKKDLDAEQQVQQKINDLLKEALIADASRQGEIRQQVAELQKQQEKYKDIKNLAQGILPKDKEAVFTIDGQLSEETKKNLREIENVTIDDKTMTVTANTQEAMQKVQDLIGQVSTTTLQIKAKSDGAPTFTMAQLEGMSFDNQIPTTRGNRGRAQDKLDLATAAFATGGTSDIDFSNYISGIKNAMSNANLGDELYTSMTEKLKDATTVSTLLQEMMERGLAGADLESTAQALKEKLLSPEGIDQTAIQSFLDELNKQIEKAGGVGLKLNADTGEVSDDKGKDKDDGKDLKKFNDGIGKLSSGLSQVTGGLKAVGVEIPKEVDQVLGVINGVSQIISGVGTIISIFGTSAITANTTAVGVNTAAIGGLIAALEFNSATNFFGLANGGIVPAFAHGGLIGRAAGGMMIPGNSMSGDRLRMPVDGGRGMIGVNSGELILNKSSQNSLAASLLNAEALIGSIKDYSVSLGNAQQGVIADALEGGGMQIIDIDWVMRGEDMRAVINNNGRRTGRGEIVQSRRNRS